jgi:DUF4097 and DUF4098 domain-containing protein YvlB
MKKLATFIIVFIAVYILCMSCSSIIDPDDPFDDARYTAESSFSFTMGVDDKSKLELTSIDGDVKIVGVDKANEVVIAGKKVVKSDSQRDADAYLKNLKVSIAESGNTIYVASEQPEDNHGRSVTINYEVQVPRHWATAVELVNGSCLLDSLEGDIVTKLTNGNIILGDVFANAYLRVTNGQISGKVNLPIKGVLNAQSTNGLISFNVPKTISAQLTAKVTNGTVSVSGLTLDNMWGNQREIHGTIGPGEGRIELQTTNGNINVIGF